MDITRFTPEKTGELVPVMTEDGPDYAFIPNALPPQWEFPSRLWPLLNEAHKQLARLDEKGRTVPNPTLLLDPLQKREALRSSSIEGTYATAKELLLFELAPREPHSRTDKANDWLEVANYDAALRHGVHHLENQIKPSLPLSKRLIEEMHRLLLFNVRGNDSNAGQFRTKHVYVGSGQRYVPPPPGDVLKKCMNDFEMYMDDGRQKKHYDPLVLSYMLHYQFEAIHPFRDGNGRIGRLLLALTTYSWCEMYLPWLYMSAYFERFKDEYVDNMFRVSTHGDWSRWIEFCLTGTVAQCKDAIRRCDELRTLMAEMHSKLDGRPRMSRLIEHMFMSPAFSASEICKWGETSMPTARRDIDELVESGYVRYLSGERPKLYYVPRIFRIAYREGDGFENEGEEPGSEPNAPPEPSGKVSEPDVSGSSSQ